MGKYIVSNGLEDNLLWLRKLLGLWFWVHKRDKAFRFEDKDKALEIGRRETLDEVKKEKVEVISI